jgi:hypothetical protein
VFEAPQVERAQRAVGFAKTKVSGEVGTYATSYASHLSCVSSRVTDIGVSNYQIVPIVSIEDVTRLNTALFHEKSVGDPAATGPVPWVAAEGNPTGCIGSSATEERACGRNLLPAFSER